MKRSFLVWLGLCVLAAMSAGRADLVKLKDGTVLDGIILTEDDKQITVEVELATGSITRQETADKSNVVEIVRLTPEQKAERQMVREYEKAKKYQLDSAYSFPPATYDRVINDVLRKFLTQYSNSPYQQVITGLITQWETERDTVASGQTKYRGKWVNAAEAAKLAAQDRDQRLLRLGQDFLSKGRYDEAIKHLHNLSQTGKDPQLNTEARRLEAESYRLWLASLDRDQQRINDEIRSLGERAAKAQKAKERAQTSLGKISQGEVRHMGADGFAFEATRAESEAKIAENQTEQLRKELASVQQFAADLRTRAGTAASAPTPTASAVAQAASQAAEAQAAAQRAAAAEPTAMLDGVVQWVKDRWMFVAGGTVIGLWLIARLFTRS